MFVQTFFFWDIMRKECLNWKWELYSVYHWKCGFYRVYQGFRYKTSKKARFFFLTHLWLLVKWVVFFEAAREVAYINWLDPKIKPPNHVKMILIHDTHCIFSTKSQIHIVSSTQTLHFETNNALYESIFRPAQI